MKILHKCIAGYLGYYGSLEALQSQYPEGGEAGSFFLNGETSTLWMWNPVTRCWCDTNYSTAPDLVGMIIDPETFMPSIMAGKEALYYYVATAAGSYGFPRLPNTMIKIEVSCTQPSIILLQWDGSKWNSHVYPINLSPLTYHRYRGLWDKNETYHRNNDYIDVVLYNGQYYRLIIFGTSTQIAPDTNNHVWEAIGDFSALANGLQVVEKDGNGTLVLSPEMCTLRITNPDGNELAKLSIEISDQREQYVQQSFTRVSNDVTYTTIVSPNGIIITEGTNNEQGGSIITKRFTITANGIKETPIL